MVLFQPEIPPNTGNIIRLCANAGARLHLVEPLGFSLEERTLRRAGLDYHEYTEVQRHADFESCLRALGGLPVFAFSTCRPGFHTRGVLGYRGAVPAWCP